jgi:hypothetical protein
MNTAIKRKEGKISERTLTAVNKTEKHVPDSMNTLE